MMNFAFVKSLFKRLLSFFSRRHQEVEVHVETVDTDNVHIAINVSVDTPAAAGKAATTTAGCDDHH